MLSGDRSTLYWNYEAHLIILKHTNYRKNLTKQFIVKENHHRPPISIIYL